MEITSFDTQFLLRTSPPLLPHLPFVGRRLEVAGGDVQQLCSEILLTSGLPTESSPKLTLSEWPSLSLCRLTVLVGLKQLKRWDMGRTRRSI